MGTEVATDPRSVLLDAGLQLWADAGWAAVTIPALCAATGLTEAAVLAEFACPETLLTELIDDGLEERSALMLSAIDAAPQHRVGLLRASLDTLVGWFVDDPRRAVVLVEAVGSPALRQRRREANRGFAELIVSESAKLANPPDPEGVRAAALFCVGGFQALVLDLLDPDAPTSREAVVARTTALFEACLRPQNG